MRKCKQCNVKKELKSFPLGKSWKDGRRQPCRKCTQKRYQPQIDALKAAPCMDCNGKFPPEAMDYDHIRGEKSFGIGMQAYTSHQSWKRVLEEIAKCDLVCSNCHRIRTRRRRQKN